jgi:hypothetical protein
MEPLPVHATAQVKATVEDLPVLPWPSPAFPAAAPALERLREAIAKYGHARDAVGRSSYHAAIEDDRDSRESHEKACDCLAEARANMDAALAAVEEEVAGLRALLVLAEDREEALDAKVASLTPHGTCGCSYDAPDDLCTHHSPQLAASERALEEMREALGFDQPWNVRHVLEKLAESADILRGRYSYDGDGWEQIQIATNRAREIVAALSGAAAPTTEKPVSSPPDLKDLGPEAGAKAG